MPNNSQSPNKPQNPSAILPHNALAAVARAAGDLRRGHPVIIRGQAHGGGAGDLLCAAAENLQPAMLEFFRSVSAHGPLLALTANRAAVLHIPPTGDETVLIQTGRMDAKTVASLPDPASDLDFGIRGPFKRAERTAGAEFQAAVQLCKTAWLLPAAVLADFGNRHSLTPDLAALLNGLSTVTAEDILAHGDNATRSLEPVVSAQVPLEGAEHTRLIVFRPGDGGPEHLAIVVGEPHRHEAVLTRLHSECFTGDLLGSLKCDCGQQLRGAIREIAAKGSGVLIYLAQEGRGIGLINKLRSYRLQDQGFDTIEANERLGFNADERVFEPAAQILRQLGFSKIRLMTNNPEKVAALQRFGIDVVTRVPHSFPSNNHNEFYLATKAKRSGHLLDVSDIAKTKRVPPKK